MSESRSSGLTPAEPGHNPSAYARSAGVNPVLTKFERASGEVPYERTTWDNGRLYALLGVRSFGGIRR
jgi:hypothetical protein